MVQKVRFTTSCTDRISVSVTFVKSDQYRTNTSHTGHTENAGTNKGEPILAKFRWSIRKTQDHIFEKSGHCKTVT